MELSIGDIEGFCECVMGAAAHRRWRLGLGACVELQTDLIDPCVDPSWAEHVANHADATVFHGSGWARVLQATYGHRPFYACARNGDGKAALVPLMEVRSWLTGARGVSLPFTDCCDGLGAKREQELFEKLCKLAVNRRWKHLEFRGKGIVPHDATPSTHFLVHQLDLSRGFDAVEKGISGSAQGATRKARSNGVRARIEHSIEGMRAYYRMHAATRRRHGLPPQPWSFFQNVHRHLISEGLGFIAVAEHEGRAIAGAVYFHNGKHAMYKYSASDFAFRNLRPANLVMSTAIRHLVELGCQSIHFGRTTEENEGLRRFKRAWGGEETRLPYYRFDIRRNTWVTSPHCVEGAHNSFFRRMPAAINRALGGLLYPHLD